MSDMSEKKKFQIDYYKVGKTPGGNQDWCKDFWMNLGGCAALAAGDMAICISKNYGLSECCPYDPDHLTKEDYNDYSMILKPYIRPRFHGVTRLSIFMDGLKRYLSDRGYVPEFEVCHGSEDEKKAEQFLVRALENNLPVACLILFHNNPEMKDLSWHWFSITGYVYKEDRMYIYYHTYGGKHLVDFAKLWDTGSPVKGGMISLKNVIKKESGKPDS